MWIENQSARLYADLSGNKLPSVVLVHGLGGSRLSWGNISADLAAERRVLAVDLRGCGRSERGSGSYSLDLAADDIVSLIDALDEERVHLVGHSLGGVVCQNLLIRHSDRCRSAVLVSTSSRVGDQARRNWRRLAESVERQGLSRLRAGNARGFTASFARLNPQVVDLHAQLATSTDPSVYAEQARAASDYDYTDALGGVAQAVLVVQGLADQLTSPGGSVLLSRALDNARLEMVDSVGHNAHLEMGSAFTALLDDFFADVEKAKNPG